MVECLRFVAGDRVGLAQHLCRFQVIVAVAPQRQSSSAPRLNIDMGLLHGQSSYGPVERRRLATTWAAWRSGPKCLRATRSDWSSRTYRFVRKIPLARYDV